MNAKNIRLYALTII